MKKTSQLFFSLSLFFLNRRSNDYASEPWMGRNGNKIQKGRYDQIVTPCNVW